MKLAKKENFIIAFLFFTLLNLAVFVNSQTDNPPKIISFSAQPNPAFVNSEVTFIIEATDDSGLDKISLQEGAGSAQDCECHGSRTCTSQTCCSSPPCFTRKFKRVGTYTFCAFAQDTNGQQSEKICINVTVRTVSECEDIKLYDSSQDVTIATKIKTRKLYKETDGFDGYPLECCPYCQDIEINLSNCERIAGSMPSYNVITYEHTKEEIYTKLNFPENIFSSIEKPLVLCYAKKSDTETIFGVADGAKYTPIDFISNDEKLWYWLIERVDDNKKDKYILSEEDISLEKETKTYLLVDSEKYSSAVNRLMLEECYYKQPESLECTFDCESPCQCPCSGATLCPLECCAECQQVYDYSECIYSKYVSLWGRPYTDYLFCYKTPLKDTAWCKQRTDISSSVVNFPWYSFSIKDKEEKTQRSLEIAPQEYLDDISVWNEMQEVQEMPDRSVIKHVTKVPEVYCDHNFESKLFRTVWAKIFTNTPYLNDERNDMKWGRTGKSALYVGGGFRREPSCWWECCRQCAPFCNCFCSQCPYWPCCLYAYFTSGVTNVIRFMMPNTEISTSGLQLIQNAPNKVTVTNGALTVISTGNMPFAITSSIFTRDSATGTYTLTLVYTPSNRRNQFVVTQDMVFNYNLKESAEMLVVDLKESFETSLIDHTWACVPPECPCLYAGAVSIETYEKVSDSLGMSVDFDMKKIEALKTAAKNFVDRVVPDVEVGLVGYSDSVISSLPLTTDASALNAEINSYKPLTSTCTSCGISKGTELLSGFSGSKSIILFSDGIPNVPGDAEGAARTAVEAAVAEGIKVHTVAIGDDAALDFMEELAKLGNGTFYAVTCECPLDCIYRDLAAKVKSELPSAVVLVNDISGSMDWRASLNCPGTGPPVVHENILRDINLSITGNIDNYGDEKFITQNGIIKIEVAPDIASKLILKVKNSTLEYSTLEYPVKHDLYLKEIRHGIYEPGYPYTPINPTPEYGYLPAHPINTLETSYGYESRSPTATNFEFPYPSQGKEICPSNCFCPSNDITDVTCVDYSEKPQVYYKRKDCICSESDQTYLRPVYSTETYHDEEFYYYDFVDLYTKERSDLKTMGQYYPEKLVSPTGGSLTADVKHIFQIINGSKPQTCGEVKAETWQIPSNAVLIPTDPADAVADDAQNEPLKVHGLAWKIAECAQTVGSCGLSSQFKIGRIIGPIDLLRVKYNAGAYVVVSSGIENPKGIVDRIVSQNGDFSGVNYNEAGSDGSATIRKIFPLRVCIRDGTYDQPTKIFSEMKIPYKTWTINCLDDSDVLIFGCEAGPETSLRKQVQDFVKNCGTYIGTDWNYVNGGFDSLFPGYFTASKAASGSAEIWEGATKGSYDLPQELKEFFQSPYESVSSWHLLDGTIVIDSIDNPETKVLARGSYSSGQTDKPMAVTFKYGNGRVFYYTFHIEGAASPSQKAFMSSFYSSAGTTITTGPQTGGVLGTYIINFTAIQFPELLKTEDFEDATLTVFIHFRNDTTTQTYALFPPRRLVTPPNNKEFYVNITMRESSKIIIENITPERYNLNPGTSIIVKLRLINPRTGIAIPMRKITVRVEGYGISQEIKTDSEGKATFAFKLGEESTKIKFEFSGDNAFVKSEISDYVDVVAFKKIWWFLSPEVLLLFIVLVSAAFFYRWFRGGRVNIGEMEKEIKEEKKK